MATRGSVLEKKEKRQFINDSIPLQCTTLTSRILPTHVEYIIRMQRGPNPEDKWDVMHRYSEFAALYEFLETSGISITIPPKKVFGTKDKEVIAERQKGLQAFLDTVLCEPLLASTWEVKRFVDPATYCEDLHESALRNISMVFRSHPEWTVGEPVRNIGWRFRKHYYLVKNRHEEKVKYFLTWVEPGPDFSLSDKDLESSLKVLVSIKHPYILSTLSAMYNGVGVAIMRHYCKGSLRDLIYNCRPGGHVLKKYGTPCKWRVLTVADVTKYGRQILEALKFLLDKGFVPGHVHAGNVMMFEGGVCRLSEMENSLLGLSSCYQHYLYNLRRIQTTEAEVSYCFGQLLYEMAMGRQLHAAVMETTPTDMPISIRPVIESLLTREAIKNGLPSVKDLITNEFFSSTVINVEEKGKPVLKVSTRLKEELQKSKLAMESRLQAQQKMVQQQKRLVKAKESLLSDDEKRKRQKLHKKQMSERDDDAFTSYPTTEIRTQPPPSREKSASTRKSSSTSSMNSSSASKQRSVTKHSSTSSATPKPPPAPSAPPPPAAAAAPPPPKTSSERGALLGSIHSFTQGKLRKTVTNDRSTPKV